MNMLALLPPGPFAIYPVAGQQIWDSFAGTSLHLHLTQYEAGLYEATIKDDAPVKVRVDEGPVRPARKPYPMNGSVALLSLAGPMSKGGGPSLSDACSTVALRRQVRQASADADVSAILLTVDSPGGEVAGTADLAGDVWKAAQGKPLYAYIEDFGASAAYWVASQANAVYANPSALVGSIGIYMVVPDTSDMAAKEGVKVHVVRAGDHKGTGVLGAPITDDHLTHFQGIVNDLNRQFLAAVKTGRGLDLTQNVAPANGQVYVGAKARAAGLVDGITSRDNVLAKLQSYKPT